ncbi:MAG: KTSC domain-containing protein [Dokdonella sp.]
MSRLVSRLVDALGSGARAYSRGLPKRRTCDAALHEMLFMDSPGKIQSMSYDCSRQELTVSFDSNRTVVFSEVPSVIRQSLQDAHEPDAALMECVVGKYPWIELRASPWRN